MYSYIFIAITFSTFVPSVIAGSAPLQSDGDSPLARREYRGQKTRRDRLVSHNRELKVSL